MTVPDYLALGALGMMAGACVLMFLNIVRGD